MDVTQGIQTLEAQIVEVMAALRNAQELYSAATTPASRTTWEGIILASSTTLQQLTTQKTLLLETLAATGPQTPTRANKRHLCRCSPALNTAMFVLLSDYLRCVLLSAE